jgi:hypothetical protein
MVSPICITNIVATLTKFEHDPTKVVSYYTGVQVASGQLHCPIALLVDNLTCA